MIVCLGLLVHVGLLIIVNWFLKVLEHDFCLLFNVVMKSFCKFSCLGFFRATLKHSAMLWSKYHKLGVMKRYCLIGCVVLHFTFPYWFDFS